MMHPAHLVLAAGVGCALHVGKLPPSVPVLRETLGVTLVQAGFLLSLVQLAGMTLGLLVGAAADRLGPRRVMLAGLGLLSVASAAGAWAGSAPTLMLCRALEGLGFLLAVLPAPGVIRRLVHEPARLSRMLGLWGAYMPLGTATALLLLPAALATLGWQAVWLGLAAVTGLLAVAFARGVPVTVDQQGVNPGAGAAPAPVSLRQRLGRTLRSPGPWAVALAFGMYSGQWLSVIGFLPTIYLQAGIAGGWVAVLTALASAVNMAGNIGAGRLLGRGVPPAVLLWSGYAAMATGAWLAFGTDVPALVRYLAVLAFSGLGGMVPATLFAMAVRLSPGEDMVSTTVGFVQQWSALGQFLGPPAVAAVAAALGGWQGTWWVTGGCCVAGALCVGWIARLIARC